MPTPNAQFQANHVTAASQTNKNRSAARARKKGRRNEHKEYALRDASSTTGYDITLTYWKKNKQNSFSFSHATNQTEVALFLQVVELSSPEPREQIYWIKARVLERSIIPAPWRIGRPLSGLTCRHLNSKSPRTSQWLSTNGSNGIRFENSKSIQNLKPES